MRAGLALNDPITGTALVLEANRDPGWSLWRQA
jgi:hypothetical protein